MFSSGQSVPSRLSPQMQSALLFLPHSPPPFPTYNLCSDTQCWTTADRVPLTSSSVDSGRLHWPSPCVCVDTPPSLTRLRCPPHNDVPSVDTLLLPAGLYIPSCHRDSWCISNRTPTQMSIMLGPVRWLSYLEGKGKERE